MNYYIVHQGAAATSSRFSPLFGFALLAFVALSGCGQGYEIEITESTDEESLVAAEAEDTDNSESETEIDTAVDSVPESENEAVDEASETTAPAVESAHSQPDHEAMEQLVALVEALTQNVESLNQNLLNQAESPESEQEPESAAALPVDSNTEEAIDLPIPTGQNESDTAPTTDSVEGNSNEETSGNESVSVGNTGFDNQDVSAATPENAEESDGISTAHGESTSEEQTSNSGTSNPESAAEPDTEGEPESSPQNIPQTSTENEPEAAAASESGASAGSEGDASTGVEPDGTTETEPDPSTESELDTITEDESTSAVVDETSPSEGYAGSEQLTPEENSQFEIISVTVSEITENSVQIDWQLSDYGTGQVHFGLSSAYDLFSIEETRFKFDAHRQRLSNLEPDTTYHFAVRSINQAGIEVFSEDATFKTAAIVTGEAEVNNSSNPEPATVGPAAAWPVNADESLPMAGIFYGQHEAGLVTGNASIALESSRRFRAEKSGMINAIRYNNRTLLEYNISSRCKPSAPNSLWCKCVNAGLDKYTCGYTLGNSYSVGNGGSIVVEIRPDDGTLDHHPSDTILGRTAGIFVPVERANEHYPILELEAPVYIQAGKIYHLVYTNLNPPTSCRFSGLSVQQAAGCPRHQGAIGLNGTTQATLFGSSKRFGPFGGDASGNLIRYSTTGNWSDASRKLSWYEIRYSDGTWVGDSHTGYGSTANGRQFLTEKTLVRQVFTVQDSTRFVDGVWVYFGHAYTFTPDGSPMTVTLKDNEGTVLASGLIESSADCAKVAKEGYNKGVFVEQHCRVWEHADFGDIVSLLEGSKYSLEFSATQAAGFSLHTFFPLNYGAYRSTSRNHWQEAHAEVSKNGGATWAKLAGDYYPDRDVNMLFTIAGMPKQLP